LIVIVAICLLVFGAEHLPGMARTIGAVIRRRGNGSNRRR